MEAPTTTTTTADAVAPAAGWASGPLGLVQEADREIARWTAIRARAIAEFAATRPASDDRQPGEPGAMSADRRAARPAVLAQVSEWAAPELSIAQSTSREAAARKLEQSMTLVHKLPATLEALQSGLLHDGHLFTMLERVATVADDTKRAQLERDLLAWVAARAAKRQITTPPQLADKARRMGLGRDPKQEAADLVKALRARGAWVRPDRRAGMAVLEVLLTAPQAQAIVDALGRYVDALPADPADTRTRREKMVDVLMDLVLRPGESLLPPVQAQLTLVAGIRTLLGGGAPGQVGGDVVPAEMIRALARALGLLDLTMPGATADAAPDSAADATPSTAPEAAPDTAPTPSGRPAGAWDPTGLPDDTWPEQARADFERWEAEIDARALAGVWGGEDDPPPDVQQAWWEEEARRNTHEPPDPGEPEPDPHDDAGRVTGSPTNPFCAACARVPTRTPASGSRRSTRSSQRGPSNHQCPNSSVSKAATTSAGRPMRSDSACRRRRT